MCQSHRWSHSVREGWARREDAEMAKEKGRERGADSCRASILSRLRVPRVSCGSSWWSWWPRCYGALKSVLVEMVCTLSKWPPRSGQSRVTSGLAGATTRCTSGDTIPSRYPSFLHAVLCAGRAHCRGIYGDSLVIYF